jgi:hypothetical protein
MATTADAVARETAWLRTSGDGLPALLVAAGGFFDILQGYATRTPGSEQRSLYVTRRTIRNKRFAAVRQMNKYDFLLRIWWPARDGDGAVETDQADLDAAVEAVFARVGGTLGDKTHGGRFLSVAEDGADLTAVFADPMQTIPNLGALLVDITYSADDVETIG